MWAHPNEYSPKSRLVAFLFAFFLGSFGVHRFYVGKVATGVLWLCTLGFVGLGALIDCLVILLGGFRDGDGKMLVRW